MALHAKMQTFQTQIEQEGILGALGRAKIAHELHGGFGDKCTFFAKALGIGYAMIAIIGRAETRELVLACIPIEASAVHNATANPCAVTIHVFGGGMGDDICPPLKGPAFDGRWEGIIHNQGYAIGMRHFGEFFDIQNGQRRVCDGFAKNSFGVFFKRVLQCFFATIRINEGKGNPHALHRDSKKVIASAINARRCHHMIPTTGNIENGIKRCRLSRGGKHGSRAPFKSTNFGGYTVARGVLKTCVKITTRF